MGLGDIKGVLGAVAISRRSLLKAAAASSAALTMPAVWTSARAERKLVVRDPGGEYLTAFGEAFYEPFTKETGIAITNATSEPDPIGQIRAMVETKNYVWDVALIAIAPTLTAVEWGVCEEIAPAGGPGAFLSKIPEHMRTPYILGTNVFATVMAYRTDTMKKAPRDWKDFWDLDGLPGVRSLYKAPFDTLEFALLADGVDPANLYPLDLDRAFKKLDQVKDQIKIWWSTGAQTSQLLSSGEADVVSAWNGRAQLAINDGSPVALNWNQSLWTYEGWVILKGGPNVDLCREFVEFCAQGKQQALYTKSLAYGPTALDAYDHIDPAIAKTLPTYPENFKQSIEVNAKYWAQHQEAAQDRFNAWLLG